MLLHTVNGLQRAVISRNYPMVILPRLFNVSWPDFRMKPIFEQFGNQTGLLRLTMSMIEILGNAETLYQF